MHQGNLCTMIRCITLAVDSCEGKQSGLQRRRTVSVMKEWRVRPAFTAPECATRKDRAPRRRECPR